MITAIPSDRALVRRSLRGNRDAFGRLVERHQPTVYAIALAASRNVADAEDAVQDAFIRAFESLPNLRDPHRFGAWVAHIARNRCRDRWRDDARREPLVDDVPSASDTHAVVSGEEVHALVQAQLAQLDETSREVLTLYYFAGRNTREIAGLLEISTAAAKKRLERARAAFSQQLLGNLDSDAAKEREAARLKRILLALAATTPAWFTGLGEAGAALGVATVTKVAAGLAVAAAAVAVGAALLAQSQNAPVAAVPVETAEPDTAVVEAAPVVVAQAETPASEVAATPQLTAANSNGPARALQLGLGALEQSMEAKLGKPVSVNMEDENIDTIMSFLSEYLEFSIVILPPDDPVEASENLGYGPFVTDGTIAEVAIESIPLHETLDTILTPLGLAYVVEPGYVWVSSPARIQTDVHELDRIEYEPYGIDEALFKPIRLSMTNEHVVNVLDFLSEYTEVGFLVDFRAVSPELEIPKAAKQRTRTEKIPFGYFIVLEGFPNEQSEPCAAISVKSEPAQILRVGDIAEDFQILEILPDEHRVSVRNLETGETVELKNESVYPPLLPTIGHAPGWMPHIQIQNVELSDFLRGAMRILEYDYYTRPGFILCSPVGTAVPAIADGPAFGDFDPSVAAWLEDGAAFELNSNEDNIDDLARIISGFGSTVIGEDFTVAVEPAELGQSEVATAVIRDDLPFALALDAILLPMGLTWSIDGHTMTIFE